MPTRNRIIGFATLAIVCLAVGAGYLLYAGDRSNAEERNAKKVSVTDRSELDAFVAEPHMLLSQHRVR